ncbi:MAG TPA: hypothetical protein VM580_13845 [Labilithrix sp.]|jgi:hypothetical protein|nr:hypothetical protein [Labilithrix sp.]
MGGLVLLVVGCGASPLEEDVLVEVNETSVVPTDCRDAFETKWGAENATLPENSGCGRPSGRAADQFPTDQSGGKSDNCLVNCSTTLTTCTKRCTDRYPVTSALPATAPTVAKATATGKAIGLKGATSNQGAGIQFVPPPAPTDDEIALGQCIGTCNSTFQACTRGCAVQR